MLERLNLDQFATPIKSLVYRVNDGEMELNPPYQRGLVWGIERKQNLWFSILQRLPVGAIILNDRWKGWGRDAGETDTVMYAVVDGKQRLSAITGFFDNEYGLPRSFFDAEDLVAAHDAEVVYAKDLTRQSLAHMGSLTVTLIEASVSSVDAEKDLFDRVNFGGVAQGDTDL